LAGDTKHKRTEIYLSIPGRKKELNMYVQAYVNVSGRRQEPQAQISISAFLARDRNNICKEIYISIYGKS
jgi:hypothetical protein